MSEDLFGHVDRPAAAQGPGHGTGGSLTDSSTYATAGGALTSSAPLAVRLRPRTVDEIVGQQHLLAAGSPLRRLASGEAAMSVFLWGPPGVGKTTIASVVSRATSAKFVEISAVTAGVKDVRGVLDAARADLAHGQRTVLFVDEVHRFNKAQQDVLLPAVENRLVTLIAATTENPSFSVISPLLSRSLLLTLRPLTDEDIAVLLDRALIDERGVRTAAGGRVAIDDAARADLVRLSGGDARRALTFLEEAAAGAETDTETDTATGAGPDSATPRISTDVVARAVDRASVRYDRDGDQHYDVISAFIKSIRGSDVQASLHYLARMVEAGEDPRFIARRLVILASEDIGMADPSALQVATAAASAVAFIGMPEGRINLAQAVVHLALAPKSNAVVMGVDAAIADVRAGRIGTVPSHLRDAHYPGAASLGHGTAYVYAHDAAHGVAAQQYLPDELTDAVYYTPTTHGAESAVTERLKRINGLLGR